MGIETVPSTFEQRQSDVLARLENLWAQVDQLTLDAAQAGLNVGTSPVTPRWIRSLIEARRKREAIFGECLFADPAWDILLELYEAALLQRKMPMSDVGEAAGVPPTTALRWITRLDELGWVMRKPDPLDGRRVFVDLSPRAIAAMERYLASTGAAATLI